jgi:hypothetical protein
MESQMLRAQMITPEPVARGYEVSGDLRSRGGRGVNRGHEDRPAPLMDGNKPIPGPRRPDRGANPRHLARCEVFLRTQLRPHGFLRLLTPTLGCRGLLRQHPPTLPQQDRQTAALI